MVSSCKEITQQGAPASYIPILQQADPNQLGICTVAKDGTTVAAGDTQVEFSIQSIVKLLIFTCCLLDCDKDLVARKVSVEPTSDGFNSIKNLEMKNSNKPLNPMINAGAIVCMSLVKGDTAQEKSDRILRLLRKMADRDDIAVDEEIYLCEKETGARNRALAYYMKSTGIIEPHMDVEEILDAYFRACSFKVTCVDLAKMALTFACNGTNPQTGEKLISKQIARTIKATMMMCGMYNESGYVALHVGLPTKSGVGGGILSLVPEQLGIGIFGPALNEAGSSVAGLELLKRLSKEMDASIF